MSQKVSVAAGNSIYNTFDTLIPSIGDTADIVEAFRLYHYGKAGFTVGEAPATLSIYNHFQAMDDRIETLEDAPTGGKVLNEVPHDLDAGAVKVEIPDGFIWVDGNAVGDFNIQQGTVSYTNNPPSTYSHGLIWVDKDEPMTDPFNLDNFLTQSAVDLVYLRKNNASATYATIADYSPKVIPIVSSSAATVTVSSNELYKVIIADSSSDMSIIVNPDSVNNFPIGASFSILKVGSGNVTVNGAAGVSVNGTPGTRLRAIYSFATCLKVSSNSWVVIGDTAVA